jgi:transcriptional regulator with XRE-family HTH domain
MPLNTKLMEERRAELGWSMAEAAEKAGLTSKGHWSDIVRGAKSNVRLSTLEQIAKALKLKPQDLIQ